MKAHDLKNALAAGEDIMLIDVREADEYAQGDAITGAQNIPMGKVFVEAGKGNLPKDKKIVSICKSGVRCEIVARELKEKGFDIDYLEGGIGAWKEQEAS